MTNPEALISDPMAIFAIIAGVAALVSAASGMHKLKPLFNIVPPVVWMYFLPLILTSVSVIPSESPLYDWMATYLLPLALLLITVSINLRAVATVGRIAITMFFIGTAGIAFSSIVVFYFLQHILPSDAWQSMAMLSAAWIGGSANMLAVHQSLGGDPSLFGPVVITDTLVGYGWLGALIAVSSYQTLFDKKLRADRSHLDTVVCDFESVQASRRLISLNDILIMICGGFCITIACRFIAGLMPQLGDPVVVSQSTWTIILVVTLGLFLSFTRVRRISEVGSFDFGYVALFLLLTSVGAQADFRAILEAPQILLAGGMVMAFHIIILLVAAYLLRAPFIFVVTGSMANVGGAVSAPIAATAYSPALAPLGALLGILGYIVGIYVPVLVATVLSLIANI